MSRNGGLFMEEKESKSTDGIILSHLVFAMTAGAIPIPLLDIAAVTAIQIDMIRQLATHYNLDFNQDLGKSLVSSMIGSSLAKIGAYGLARAGASMIKSVPVVGSVIGIGSQIILSGATTYALGKLFDTHFSKNGTLFDFKVDDMKEQFNDLFKKGKKVAEDLGKKNKDGDIFTTIEKLNKLKEIGAITEQEYEETKKKLLEKFQNNE